MQGKKFLLVWTILFFLLSMGPGHAQQKLDGKSYALIVGISKYTSLRWENLPYARSDAAILSDILRKKGFQVMTLYDREATRTAILARLENNIAPRLNPDDRFLFYFAGHGYSKQIGNEIESYLIPYDKESIDENNNSIYISMSDLARQSRLMASVKNQLYIIDAPVSVTDESLANEIDLSSPDYLSLITRKKSRQLISAGVEKEKLVDSKGPVYNVLTNLFIKALKKGMADINGDGWITCLEMWGYIMPRASDKGQTPDYGTFVEHDMGEFIFSSPDSIRKQKTADKKLVTEDLTKKEKQPPIVDLQDGRLFIDTIPKNAKVRILNIVPPYRYGMMLSPGSYKIEVSKPDYETVIKWITIGKKDRTDKIKLKSKRAFSSLYVHPKPENAKVRILNIIPKYTFGMALQTGRYLLEVSSPGYKTYKEWITITKGFDNLIEPELQSIKPRLSKIKPKKPKQNNYSFIPEEDFFDTKKEDVFEDTNIQPEITPPLIEQSEIIQTKKDEIVSKKEPESKTIESKIIPKNIKTISQPEQVAKKIDQKATLPQNKILTSKTQKEENKIKPKKSLSPIQPQKTPKDLIKEAKTMVKTKSKPEDKTTSFKQKDFSDLHSSDDNEWIEPITGMPFIWVEGGCFEMGCGSWSGQCDVDEMPVHKVCVDSFWMGKYEVTQGNWQMIMEKNPSLSAYGDNYPVEKVSWNETQEFIEKLQKQSNNKFQLPSEAQWEYACRSGGKPHKYAGQMLDINSLGWFSGNSSFITHSVGNKAPNDLGLYDMSGNVSEWCQDNYLPNAYKLHDKKNPIIRKGAEKVVRGGDWSDELSCLRSSDRRSYSKDLKSKDLGFRLIRIHDKSKKGN